MDAQYWGEVVTHLEDFPGVQVVGSVHYCNYLDDKAAGLFGSFDRLDY